MQVSGSYSALASSPHLNCLRHQSAISDSVMSAANIQPSDSAQSRQNGRHPYCNGRSMYY